MGYDHLRRPHCLLRPRTPGGRRRSVGRIAGPRAEAGPGRCRREARTARRPDRRTLRPHPGCDVRAARPDPRVRPAGGLGRPSVVRRVAELAHGARPGPRPRARAGGPRARRVAEAERRHAPGPDLLLEGARGHPGGHARERADPARRRARGHGGARGAHRSRVAPHRPLRGAVRGRAAGTPTVRCGRGWTTAGWWWCGGG